MIRGFNKLFDNMIAMDLVQGRCPNFFFSGRFDGKDEAAPSFLFAFITGKMDGTLVTLVYTYTQS